MTEIPVPPPPPRVPDLRGWLAYGPIACFVLAGVHAILAVLGLASALIALSFSAILAALWGGLIATAAWLLAGGVLQLLIEVRERVARIEERLAPR
ncbi:MAG: hypothetical protein IT458_07470 [Planctomycetes bacterium]|nr:hypothetical protein [Planctomycetota bacterium]